MTIMQNAVSKWFFSMASLMLLANNTILANEESHSTNSEQEESISYDFFDITYASIETDIDDGDGLLLRGSKSVTDTLYLHSEYSDGSLDTDSNDARFFRIGIGYRVPLSSRYDGIAEFTYEDLKIEEEDLTVDEDGYGAALGLRALISEHWECTARLQYVDFGDVDDTLISIDLVYLFDHSYGVVIGYEEGEERYVSLGVRFQW